VSVSFIAAIEASKNSFEPVDEEAEVCLGHGTGHDLAAAIGFPLQDNCMGVIPIARFARGCSTFLSARVGRPTPGRDMTVDASPGRATVICGGRDPGFLEREVLRLLEMIRGAEARGATHVYAA
jgi:hypothetical protein